MIMRAGNESAVERHHRLQSTFRGQSDHRVPSIIAAPDSVDAWRHFRMYEPLLPFVDQSHTWLTIGDSGADAYWLRLHGAGKVVASSITDVQLRGLQAKGHLLDVQVAAINAEKIDYPDDSFDFVLCKEAFHHFARPMVGFYEMLRVAREGVILLAEPNSHGRRMILDFAKDQIKKFLRKGSDQRFENSGNFIYGLSLSEFYKVAAALQYRDLYYLHLNDFFVPSLARRPLADRRARRLTQLAVSVQNIAAYLGLMNWGSITLVMLKRAPSEELAQGIVAAGFKKREVPLNPYI